MSKSTGKNANYSIGPPTATIHIVIDKFGDQTLRFYCPYCGETIKKILDDPNFQPRFKYTCKCEESIGISWDYTIN